MARVDRYESKLRLMAFMGIYKELIISLQPVKFDPYLDLEPLAGEGINSKPYMLRIDIKFRLSVQRQFLIW